MLRWLVLLAVAQAGISLPPAHLPRQSLPDACALFSGSPQPVSCTDLSSRKLPIAADCIESLSCHYTDIDLWSMSDRLTFIQGIERKHGPSFGAAGQFKNIEAIITFFSDNNLGAPGSWVSYTDTAILEAIERGFAIALGLSTDGYGNPGSNLWAAFLLDLKNGKLSNRYEHDHRWSVAEQSCTNYGAEILSPKHRAMPSRAESAWFKFSNIYRWVMRNEEGVIASFPPFFTSNAKGFILWFTDVANFEVTRVATQLAWEVSLADAAIFNGAVVGAAGLFIFLPHLIPEWIRVTGGL